MSFYPRHPVADADYLLKRAQAEAQLAGEARPAAAEAAHHALASLYLDRLFGGDENGAPDESSEAGAALLLAIGAALTAPPPSLKGAPIADLVLELERV